MTDTVKGRTALVTGSTSGIGLGIAVALAAEGADVTLNGRSSESEAARALDRVRQTAAGGVHYVSADLSQMAGVKTLIAAATQHLGRIDILVNNAGIQHVAPIDRFPPDKWDLILALNLSAAFHATRLTLAGMKERGWGRIVNIASAHSLVASPYKAAYVAAKHGLLGLTRVTALEAAEHDVTCNAICPGYVRTPLVDKQIGDQAKAHGIPEADVIRDVILKPQPNKRFATVEEIGALTVFLCGSSGQPITGAALPVDGGWTAH
jgi:3-hydroxybutyrate dehydrogenase